MCEQVMQSPVRVVFEDDTVADAARLMRSENIGFLPVCNADGRVIGVLTDRDIVIRAVVTGSAPTMPVAQVMTRAVVGCRPDEPLFTAQCLMRTRHCSRVLCLDGAGRPVGVISFSELARNEDGFRLAKTVRQMACVGSDFPPPASSRRPDRRLKVGLG